MLFNSYEFIFLFLPVSVIGFYLFSRINKKYSIIWLVSCSLFFYGWWNTNYLLLISCSIIVNYCIGLIISNHSKSLDTNKALIWLVNGLIFNLALLFYYKYSHFFLSSLNGSITKHWDLNDILLPIGISFFTFQQIAFLIDTHRQNTVQHGFMQYSLFVLFFPQLIAGPIVHHSQIIPQFNKDKIYSFLYKNLSIGLTIFIIGLFKKVVIADNLAIHVNPVFDSAYLGQEITFFQAWTATLAYSLQIYFDFSGYCDMAIGLARLFGIKLPINFHSPYKANNIIEFWKRWHITLSNFLRDYVYIPLGGNRKGTKRRFINIILTMLLAGLWHGAAWTFIMWGVMHGLFMVINHIWIKLNSLSSMNVMPIIMARILTLLSILLAWVMFRADNIPVALEIYKGLLNLPSLIPDRLGDIFLYLKYLGFNFTHYQVDINDIQLLLFLLFCMMLVQILPNTQEILSRYRPAFDFNKNKKLFHNTRFFFRWRPTLKWSIIVVFIFLCSIMNLSNVSEFLYFQF